MDEEDKNGKEDKTDRDQTRGEYNGFPEGIRGGGVDFFIRQAWVRFQTLTLST